MKNLVFVFLVYLLLSCRPNQNTDYYRITIQTPQGMVLFDERGPFYDVEIHRSLFSPGHIVIRVYTASYTVFEIAGTGLTDLVVTRKKE